MHSAPARFSLPVARGNFFRSARLLLNSTVALLVAAAFIAGCSSTRTTTTTGGTETSVGATNDADVSRSAGSPNGVVVLWPRVIPSTMGGESHDLAGALQNHLKNLVSQALPGRAIDVRPEPERVCPQAGCEGVAVGILLLRDLNGCSALALVSAPGRSPARLIPWVGSAELRQPEAPFREPPENQVTVKDFMPCSDVLGRLTERDAEIVAAIRAAAGG